MISGNKNSREWHTDWPHDPWAYGGGKKSENIGCIKEPFPDLIMGLVAVHHLSDPGELGVHGLCQVLINQEYHQDIKIFQTLKPLKMNFRSR